MSLKALDLVVFEPRMPSVQQVLVPRKKEILKQTKIKPTRSSN